MKVTAAKGSGSTSEVDSTPKLQRGVKTTNSGVDTLAEKSPKTSDTARPQGVAHTSSPEAVAAHRILKGLATNYLATLDQHGPVGNMIPFLSSAGDLDIALPGNQRLTNAQEYTRWYENIRATFGQSKHSIEAFSTRALPNGEFEVILSIHFQAIKRNPAANENPRVNMTAHRIWTVKPSDNAWVIKAQRTQGAPPPAFSSHRMREFAVNYLNTLDRQPDVSEMLQHLAPDDFSILLADGTALRTPQQFTTWYQGIVATFQNPRHTVENLSTRTLPDGSIELDLTIHFQADKRNPKPNEPASVDMRVQRTWVVQPNSNGAPVIVSQRPQGSSRPEVSLPNAVDALQRLTYAPVTPFSSGGTVPGKNTVWDALKRGDTLVTGVEVDGPNPMTTGVVTRGNYGTMIMNSRWPDGTPVSTQELQETVNRALGTPLLPIMRFDEPEPQNLKKLLGTGLMGAMLRNPSDAQAVREFFGNIYFGVRPGSANPPSESSFERPIGRRTVGPDEMSGSATLGQYTNMVDALHTMFVGGVTLGRPVTPEFLAELANLKSLGLRLLEIDRRSMKNELSQSWTEPELTNVLHAQVKAIEEAAKAAGIPLSTALETPAELNTLAARGYRHVTATNESAALKAGFERWMGGPLEGRQPIPGVAEVRTPSPDVNDLRTFLQNRDLITFAALSRPDWDNAQQFVDSGLFQAVAIEAEHGVWNTQSAAEFIQGLSPHTNVIVRLGDSRDEGIETFIESGARALFATTVKSAAEAKTFVDKVQAANQKTYGAQAQALGAIPVVMMETAESVQHADEIASMLDKVGGVLHPGPLDLSLSLGAQWSDPKYLEAIQTLQEAAKKYGVPMAGVAPNIQNALAQNLGMVLAVLDAGALNTGLNSTSDMLTNLTRVNSSSTSTSTTAVDREATAKSDTALQYVKEGNLTKLLEWLKEGNDPNVRGSSGSTLLIEAAARARNPSEKPGDAVRHQMVEALLFPERHLTESTGVKKANPWLAHGEHGALPIHFVGQSGSARTAALLFEASGDAARMLEERWPLNGHSYGWQGFFYNRPEIIADAIERGFNPTVTSVRGLTVSEWAAQFNPTLAQQAKAYEEKWLQATYPQFEAPTRREKFEQAKADSYKAILDTIRPADDASRAQEMSNKMVSLITEALTLAGNSTNYESVLDQIIEVARDRDFQPNRLGGQLQQPPLIVAVTGNNRTPAQEKLRNQLVRLLLNNEERTLLSAHGRNDLRAANPMAREKHPMAVDAIIRAMVFGHVEELRAMQFNLTPAQLEEALNFQPANGLTGFHDTMLRAGQTPAESPTANKYLRQIVWALVNGARLDIPDYANLTQRQTAQQAQNNQAKIERAMELGQQGRREFIEQSAMISPNDIVALRQLADTLYKTLSSEFNGFI